MNKVVNVKKCNSYVLFLMKIFFVLVFLVCMLLFMFVQECLFDGFEIMLNDNFEVVIISSLLDMIIDLVWKCCVEG